MEFAVLASGSKANCTFIQSGDTRLLVDCGLSAKQTELRLKSLGIDPATLDAIIVTHEHRDHMHGISVMTRRYEIPVYANLATSEFFEKVWGVEHFRTGEEFQYKNCTIHPFSIVHDAVEPVGITIEDGVSKVGVATDMGRTTPVVEFALAKCNALLLESNHDKELLQISDYPWELKQRIASSHGHLSNQAAAELLSKIIHPELHAVVLGHLSERCNKPEVALAAFTDVLSEYSTHCCCASVYEPTELFSLSSEKTRERSIPSIHKEPSSIAI